MSKGRHRRRGRQQTAEWVRPLEPRTLLDSTLLKDIDPQTVDSDPGEMAVVGQTLFFTALDDEHGRELWKTDGTEAGTTLVKDINPGAGYSWPSGFMNFNGTLLFKADDGSGAGLELWRSDGTAAGTYRVKDINPGPEHSWPTDFTQVNGVVYFRTDVGFQTHLATASNDLWRTDGTEAGTFRVSRVGPVGSRITSLTDVDGTLYFSGPNPDGSATHSLWKSDGTQAGTVPASPHWFNSLYEFVVANGTLYFQGDNRLWKSDGTPAGTVRVTGADPGPSVSYLTPLGDVVYFRGSSAAGTGLWKSDGTPAGTTLVARVSSPYNITPVGDALYFTGGSDGELYKVQPGVSGATRLLRDIASPRGVGHLTVVDDRLFFLGYASQAGRELWTTDGTSAGTVVVKDIIPGPASGILSQPGYLAHTASFGGRLYFPATDPIAGLELWSSDGTDASTRRVADIETRGVSSNPGGGVSVGGHTVFFAAHNSTLGWELYKSDGTPEGTALLKDINPGPGDSGYSPVGEFNSKLIFTAFTPGFGREPWVSDRTPQGTQRLADVNPYEGASNPTAFTPAGNLLFFTATDPSDTSALWRTDGTPQGTARVANIHPGGQDAVKILSALGNRILFTANTPDAGQELWVTDGTAPGTLPLKDVHPGPLGSDPSSFAVIDGVAYFAADDGAAGRELWRTDGTPAGTHLVSDITPGPAASNPRAFFAHEGSLYFAANEQLWRYDPTAGGPFKLNDVRPGDPAYQTVPFVHAGGTLFFVGTDAQYGYELWTTDGTSQGTRLVRDIRPGSLGGTGFATFAVLDGVLYLVANDGTTGSEIWRSDGTPDGTYLLKDTDPGLPSGSPKNLAVINGALYFTTSSHNIVWRSDGTRDGTVHVVDSTGSVGLPSIIGHANGRLIFAQADPLLGVEPFAAPLAPDTTPPRVISARFAHQSAPQKIILYFTEDVSASLQSSDLILHNLTTNQPVTAGANFTYDPINHAATWTLGALPSGDYRATLNANSVTDAAGNTLDATAFALNFFHLPADANRDRSVDFQDLVILSQNYNKPAATTAQGDFTGDGLVNFEDLVLLAQRYNTRLTPPPPTAAATPIRSTKPKLQPATPTFSKRPIAKPARRTPTFQF